MNGPAPTRRISPWGAVVAVSALLVVGAAAALLIATIASSHERAVRFAVSGSLSGVSLDVGGADVEIAGGGRRQLLEVQRTDRFAFGHDAVATRSVAMGELRLRSRCPKAVPHTCSSRYRLVVPDNVPVDIRATGGTVRLRGYRGSARVTVAAVADALVQHKELYGDEVVELLEAAGPRAPSIDVLDESIWPKV